MKIILILSTILLLASCSDEKKIQGNKIFSLSSKALINKGKIPIKYADKSVSGKNISIPLNWKNPPHDTKSFALLMIDRHPIADNFINWLVIDMPAETSDIKEGSSLIEMPEGSIEFNNSYGYRGYGGPAPPKNSGVHEYEITLYALKVDRIDNFKDNQAAYYDYNTVKQILEKYIIGKAVLTGVYEK